MFGIVIVALIVFTADCGPPPSVERATVSVGNNLQGTTRTYTCLSQTVMEGTPTTTCGIDGRWSSTDLYCRRKFNSQLFNQKFSTWLLMYLSICYLSIPRHFYMHMIIGVSSWNYLSRPSLFSWLWTSPCGRARSAQRIHSVYRGREDTWHSGGCHEGLRVSGQHSGWGNDQHSLSNRRTVVNYQSLLQT